jgi:hypothetical protein
MARQKRLSEIEGSLSPKEIVLLHIGQARTFRSMGDYARSLIGKPVPGGTLCSRIEDSVVRAQRGQPREVRNRLIRLAQRDGLFLARLAGECNGAIAEQRRERHLETTLVSASMLAVTAEGTDEGVLRALGAWFKLARGFRGRLVDVVEAVRAIETEYFDGNAILYPDSEADLRACIQKVEELIGSVEPVEDFLRGEGVMEEKPPPARATRQLRAAPLGRPPPVGARS